MKKLLYVFVSAFLSYLFSIPVRAEDFQFNITNNLGTFNLVFKNDWVRVDADLTLFGSEPSHQTLTDQSVSDIVLLHDENLLMCVDAEGNPLAGVCCKESGMYCSIYYMDDDLQILNNVVSDKPDSKFYDSFVKFVHYYVEQNLTGNRLLKEQTHEPQFASEKLIATTTVQDLITEVFGIIPISEHIASPAQILEVCNELGLDNAKEDSGSVILEFKDDPTSGLAFQLENCDIIPNVTVMKFKPHTKNVYDDVYTVSYVFFWIDGGNITLRSENIKKRDEFATFIYDSLVKLKPKLVQWVFGDFKFSNSITKEENITLQCRESSSDVIVELEINTNYKIIDGKRIKQKLL